MVCLRSTPECREYICSNLFSGWEIASCWIPPILLYKKPYLSTAVHSCFVLPMSCYYSSPICLCSEQQITVGLFLSLGQPTVFFLFRLCASSPHCPHSFIVFGSVLPALFIECKTAGGQQSSVERHCAPPSPSGCPITAQRLWRSPVRERDLLWPPHSGSPILLAWLTPSPEDEGMRMCTACMGVKRSVMGNHRLYL